MTGRTDPLSPRHPDTLTPSSATLDVIGALVSKSLVRYEGDQESEPRYRMLETIREFVLEQLAAGGREHAVRQRHAAWALALAERAGPEVRGPAATVWLERLESDHPNLRGALAWFARQRDGASLARMAGALWPFWEEHAHYAEGRRWLETALALAGEAPAEVRLRLLTGAGTMARHQADYAHAIVRHEEALDLARALGDCEAEALSLNNLGVQFMELGEFDAARARFQECVAVASAAGIQPLVIRARFTSAHIPRVQRDSVAALQTMEDVLTQARTLGIPWLIPHVLIGIGLIATDLGDFDRAIAVFQEALALARVKGHLGNVIVTIEGLARVAAATDQGARATRLFAAAAAMRDELAFPLSPVSVAYLEPVLQALQETQPAEIFAADWTTGQSLSLQDAIAEAAAVSGAAAADRLPAAHRLTTRELEILRLLAAGHSNREIGELLFISPTTAARHVANLYSKLGVGSRAKATAYAHRHGLV